MITRLSQTYRIEEGDYNDCPFIPKGTVAAIIDYDKQGRLKSVYFNSESRNPPEELTGNDLTDWLKKEQQRQLCESQRLNPERTSEEVRKIAGLLEVSAVSAHDITNLYNSK